VRYAGAPTVRYAGAPTVRYAGAPTVRYAGAPTARDMKARGKREAKRSASPLVSDNKIVPALKGRNTTQVYFGLSGL